MKTLALATICATTLLTGCATKTRSIDLAGMYASESGTLALGKIEVQSAPEGVESAAIRYTEDTAWLSPTTKTHSIKIMLTGTNSVASAKRIVANICSAFIATAPALKGGACKCDPCKCADKSEEPPPSIDEI